MNDPHVIGCNPKVIAINSAIDVDLTGQVCADSIGEGLPDILREKEGN